ncbi:prickle-like protein 4 [Zonotrichia leucophrys gambelii]|uniref:prickle-like protein 4 n=1 Tax=Zonotrichia leucophrys gambelii TaxID=257770 RepID=UPI0031404331
MSLPSPAWPQQDEPSPCGTTGGLPPASSDSDSGCALEEYLEPPEVPPCSPQPGSDRDRTRLRARALLQQLPPQDCDERYCPGLAEEERRQLRAFSARRRQEALGQGLACPVPGPCHGCPCRKCGRRLNKGDPGVSASRLGDQFWHPSCFSCHFCQQQLVDLIYFQQDGRIYCGRHHAELFRPRCASCDQLIFMEECIEAEGRRWHPEHFCCLECDVPLHGQRYVMRSGRPCCRGCFESRFAEPCQACGDPIGADSERVTHQGLHWHARSPCLCCSRCRAPLRGQPLALRRGRLFCSGPCGRAQDGSDGSDGSEGSDGSSDSAIASAPSPECAPAAPSSAAGSGRDRGQGDEALSEQPPVHPAFRSPQDLGAAPRERSSDAAKEHPGVLGPAGSHPAAPQPGPEPPKEPRALLGSPEPRRAAELQAGTSRPRHGARAGHGTEEEEEEEEDSWCPTCSSSSDSDSEEEGFFFGKPIPKPGMNSLGREPVQRGRGRTAKHCSVC